MRWFESSPWYLRSCRVVPVSQPVVVLRGETVRPKIGERGVLIPHASNSHTDSCHLRLFWGKTSRETQPNDVKGSCITALPSQQHQYELQSAAPYSRGCWSTVVCGVAAVCLLSLSVFADADCCSAVGLLSVLSPLLTLRIRPPEDASGAPM